MSADVAGTAGYAAIAEAFTQQRYSFADAHAPILDLIPARASRILDIGAGAGHDAATLAMKGHRVTAIEPCDELRLAAIDRFAATSVEWLDDSLPKLDIVRARGGTFDVILISAVWMHLDPAERALAMPVVASLLSPAGVLVISLRHGSVPPGRRMFAVTAAETVALARSSALDVVVNIDRPSVQATNRARGVTWTHLAFRSPPAFTNLET